MKRNMAVSILLATAFMLSASRLYAQMDIRLLWKNQKYDSVSVRKYGGENNFIALFAKPFESKMTFSSKTPMEPGIYWVFGDTSMVEAFLISSAKGQKFTMVLDTAGTEFKNSAENTANIDYVRRVREYDRQAYLLERDFQEALSAGMPKYMMQVLVDSLTASARRIDDRKRAFQRRAADDNAGTLLASVIRTSILPETAPDEYYGDISKMQAFVIEHFFDNFAWDDPRIFNTPMVCSKIRDFCEMVYQFDRPDLDTFVVAALQKARKTLPQSYYLLFDRIEKHTGSYMSVKKVEHTYIRMLKDALAFPGLEKARRARYEKELSLIDRNHEGDIVPDFKMVVGKSDTTTLYGIEAEHMILYIEHPTCPTCMSARARMANFPVLNRAISEGKVKVLTVYIEDDPVVWEMYLRDAANPEYLHGWDFDRSIEKKGLYDIRTIPYMFLLDKDKRVIKKDLLINEIEYYVRRLEN